MIEIPRIQGLEKIDPWRRSREIAKGMLEASGAVLLDGGEVQGAHYFPDTEGFTALWTDAAVDMSGFNSRAQNLAKIGIDVRSVISFDPTAHSNGVAVVRSVDELHTVSGGWLEPNGPETKTYDSIIVVADDERLRDLKLLATGSDCTTVGVYCATTSGVPVLAVAHSGRKGTLTGIAENLADKLLGFDVDPKTIRVVVGPAAQHSELPIDLVASELDNQQKIPGKFATYYTDVSGDQPKDKIRYNNQYDTVVRLVEALGIDPSQVTIVAEDTEENDVYHSFRANKKRGTDPAARNALIIGFATEKAS